MTQKSGIILQTISVLDSARKRKRGTCFVNKCRIVYKSCLISVLVSTRKTLNINGFNPISLVVSLKKQENFSIDLFLNVIEASAWDIFYDEWIQKSNDEYISTHPLRMMKSYPAFMFEGINPIQHELGDDF